MSEEKLRKQGSHRLAFLLRDTAVYGGVAALAQATSLVSFPILARCLERDAFALADMLAVLASLIVSALALGQPAALARFFYDSTDREHRLEVVAQSSLIQVVVCGVVVAPGVALAPVWAELAFGDRELGSLFALVMLQVPFALAFRFGTNLLKWTFRPYAFATITLGNACLNVGLIVLFVFGLDLGLAGVIYAGTASAVVFGTLGVVLCRGWLRLPRSTGLVRPLLAYGWPFWAAALLVAAVPAVDRWSLEALLDLGAVAVYAVGAKVAGLLRVPIQAFLMAWGPFAMVLHTEADAQQTYGAAVRLYGWGLSCAVLTLCAVAQPLIEVLAGARYAAAAVVVLPLAFGLAIQSLGWITSLGFQLAKQTTYGFLSQLLALASAVIGLLVLVPLAGTAGAAVAVALSMGVECAARTAFAHRAHPLRIPIRAAVYLLLLGLGLALLASELGLLWRVALVVLFSGGAWFALGLRGLPGELLARRRQQADQG